MGIHELQYKKLLSELTFCNEELGYIEDSIKEVHVEFEQYYAEFLEENNLTKKSSRNQKQRSSKNSKKKGKIG